VFSDLESTEIPEDSGPVKAGLFLSSSVIKSGTRVRSATPSTLCYLREQASFVAINFLAGTPYEQRCPIQWKLSPPAGIAGAGNFPSFEFSEVARTLGQKDEAPREGMK
jgi:hypothetical protein